MLGNGYKPGMGLGKDNGSKTSLISARGNRGKFGLGYKPTQEDIRKSIAGRKSGGQGLRAVINDDQRIVMIERVMSQAEMVGLIGLCDCFVSLHRSEGFGRGMAEAMYMAKPVIATNYSGNIDFTTSETACVVNYSLIEIGKGQYPYGDGQLWADPDIEHASWHMKRLCSDRTLAAALGRAGQQFIHNNHSPTKVGERYRKRLERLGLI